MAAAARYCEVIYELAEDDIDVVQIRVAERLGVSRPAVSEMTAKMVAEGCLVIEDGRLQLTDVGRQIAVTSVRHHRLAERFLVDILGLGWAEAHELAGTWQGVIDERTEPRLVELLGDPTTCPHGNPIPGADESRTSDPMALTGEVVPLATMPLGSVGRVTRVTERLEHEPGMLRTLEHSGLIPGTRVEVLSISPDGSIAVRAARGVISLSATTARSILVRPGDLSGHS